MAKYRHHFLILLACCSMMGASVGLCVNAYGIFYTPLCQALGVGRGAVALHATISGILTGLLSPAAVKLLERHSVRCLTCLGILLSALSFLGMAFAERLWQLTLCGILRGIGNSLFYIPVVTVILGNWFRKSLGTIMGLVMAFSGIAGALFSPVLSTILSEYGVRSASLFSAVFMVIPAMPLCLFCLELTPERQGLRPYGEDEPGANTAKAVRRVNPFSVKAPVFFALLALAFLSAFITGLTSHLSGYAESIGVGSDTGAAMISAVMIGNILSKFLSGFLSDRIGTQKAFSLMFTVSCLGLICLQLVHSKIALLAVAFLFGTIYAVSAVGLPTIVRQVYGNAQYGRAFSIISIISVIAPSVSMTFIGGLYDATGNYGAVLTLCAFFGIAALLLWNLVELLAEKGNTVTDQ